MRTPRAGRFAGAAVAVPLLAGVLAVFPPAASAQGAGSQGGGLVPAVGSATRLVPAFEGLLDGVAATSPSNAWAVGNGANNNTLIVHWNGSAWKMVPAPNPDPRNDSLTSISAVSASDIWAVGNTGLNALVVHWNGKAWRLVPNPTFKGGASLTGVAAVSATNAWAVGASNGKALIEHWNGKKWLRMSAPAPASAELYSVTATSASNAWAVGDYFYGNSGSGVLILHWNGKAWRRVSAPNPLDSDMFSVAATSATNAWAVGDYSNGTITLHTLVEHWNGKAWRTVAGPSPRQGASLLAVAARSASLAFAVGDTESNPLALGNTFLEEWNGHVWREVTSPTPFPGILFGVTFSSARSAWTVGSNDSLGYNPNGWTLIERWNGTGWG